MSTSDKKKQYDLYYKTAAKVKNGSIDPKYLDLQTQNVTKSINKSETLREELTSTNKSTESLFAANVVKSAKSTIGGVAASDSISSTVNNTRTKITDAMSDVVSQTDKIKNGVADGVSLAEQSISDVLSSATSSVKSFFKTDEEKTKAQAVLNSPKADKGKKEANTKIESLSGDDQSAIAKPVSFITQTIAQVTASTKSESKSTSQEELPLVGELAKAAEALDAGSIAEAIKKISNELNSNIGKSALSLQSLVNDTRDMVDSAVKESKGTIEGAINSIKEKVTGCDNSPNGIVSSFVSTVKSGIASTLGFNNAFLETTSQLLTVGKSIGSTVASAFPGTIGKNLSALNDAFFNKTANDLMNSKIGRAATIMQKLNGICSSDDVMSIMAKLGGVYGENTDSVGNILGGQGSASASVSSKLYELAKSLCPGVTNNSGVNFALNKDSYDILLGLTADLGLSDLLSQLANCGSASNYFDQRSMSVLRSKLPSVALSGNATSMKTVVETVGAKSVPDILKNLKVLVGNMNNESAKTQANDVKELLNMCKTSTTELVDSGCDVVKALSAKNVSLMSSSNTKVVDSAIGSDNRKLTQASYLMFGYY